MTLEDEMRARLTRAFGPTRLEVVDESEAHRGHAGFREGGGTHWRVVLRAPALAAMGRLERHRAVHRALGDLTGRVHALALDLG